MSKPRFADFRPETMLTAADFNVLEESGQIKLNPALRSRLQRELQEYEFFRVLEERGEGKSLKEALRRLEKRIEQTIEGIAAVTREPGHMWEYLLAESGAEVSCLPALLATCKKENQRIGRSGRKRGFFLDRLLSQLAAVFQEADGGDIKISTKRGEKGGNFLKFAFEAGKRLPPRFRPQSKNALATRWARMHIERRTYSWVGRPYPALAKPWFKG